MTGHAIEAILITDKGGSPRFYMQVDPKAFAMDPVMASSFFAAIDMFSKEVFDQKAPVFHVDYGARVFTLINGVKTNLVAVSTQRPSIDTINVLDSLLAEFELDWLEVVNPFDYSHGMSFVEVYLESFGERVMQKISFRSLPDSWVPYFTIKPDNILQRNGALVGYIDGTKTVKEIKETSGLSDREINLEMSRLWAHRIIRFRNMLNFNDFMSARIQFLRYVQATSIETKNLRSIHPDMVNVIPHLAGLLDGRKTVRDIITELGGHHDEREILRVLDYLVENNIVEALSPEKRRILLVKETLELALHVAEEVYSNQATTNALRSVMNQNETPETLGQLRLKDDRWSVDFDFKIMEELGQKRIMLLYGEWMKILAQFVAELEKDRLAYFTEVLTEEVSARILNRYFAYDLRGFEEFSFWLEILNTTYHPHVGPIRTMSLKLEGSNLMEELANILVTRGYIIYRTDRLLQITHDESTDWADESSVIKLNHIISEYSKLGPAAKLTTNILAYQRGIAFPEDTSPYQNNH